MNLKKSAILLLICVMTCLCGCRGEESEEKKEKKSMDDTNVVSVEFTLSGDSLGAESGIVLERKNDKKCLVVEWEKESHNARVKKSKSKYDISFLEQATEIIKEYDTDSMKNFPKSNEEILDGSTARLVIIFESNKMISISSTQELSKEAQEMWDRLFSLLKNR